MWVDFGSWDLSALAAAWRSARPFPHVVVDGLVTEPAADELRAALLREPHQQDRSEIYDHFGSAQPPREPTLRSFAEALGSEGGLAAVSAITGRRVGRVEARTYIYHPGGYLLPHSDSGHGLGRLVAWAYYLSPEGTCSGGDLELFDCSLDERGEVIAAAPAVVVAHRRNRLVLFDVSGGSVHQVREVLSGMRLSLAGWYYA